MGHDAELWAALDAWDPDEALPDTLILAIEREHAMEASRMLDALAHRSGQRLLASLSLVMGLLSAWVAATPL